MKRLFVKKGTLFFSLMGIILVGLVIAGASIEYWYGRELASIPNQPVEPPKGNISIVVKIPARLLELHENGKVYKQYRIAVGKSETPSPVGEWLVVWKSYRPGDVFGTRFLALNVPWGGYGIHGTNQPWSIGRYASHGCIRMQNKDVEELYQWVPVGTPVKIEGNVSAIQRNLKLQAMGMDVVHLQMKLRELGYFEGRADGFFGGDTDVAVKRFQHDKNYKATGVVDKKTRQLLGL